MAWIYLFLGALGDILGTYMAKRFIIEGRWEQLVLIFIIFAITIWLWIEFLRYGNLGVFNTTWLVIVIVGSILVSHFLFGESLSLIQLVGVGICLFGLVLLQWPTK